MIYSYLDTCDSTSINYLTFYVLSVEISVGAKGYNFRKIDNATKCDQKLIMSTLYSYYYLFLQD